MNMDCLPGGCQSQRDHNVVDVDQLLSLRLLVNDSQSFGLGCQFNHSRLALSKESSRRRAGFLVIPNSFDLLPNALKMLMHLEASEAPKDTLLVLLIIVL